VVRFKALSLDRQSACGLVFARDIPMRVEGSLVDYCLIARLVSLKACQGRNSSYDEGCEGFD
jgi:hypothetical protein